MGILSDIQAISADSAQLAVDQAALQQLQAQVDAATAKVQSDQQASAAADKQLSDDLRTGGPVFTGPDADGSIKVYAFSDQAPGYTIAIVKPAT